ncbi:hypothetical protein [Candidatus Borrarchaeum sp.]|uniref:hypothetical protein n=1 Tax=Candidatus Borrarchaeum sp. TaxID=2846742 RepID=UPI002580A58C|nr:hypothetical protein [Candidatus Borrarchaeum sp.]
MSFGKVEGFFIDTCILLPHPLETIMKACSDFIKETASQCILSSSIKKEALDLIEQSHNTILLNFHSKLKPFLTSKGIKKITNRDGQIFADFFADQKSLFRKLPYRKSNIQYEILGAMESYIASQVHSLKDGQKLPVDIFFAAIAAELAIKKHELEAPFKGLRCEEIKPSNSLLSAVILGSLLKNSGDAVHLASALEYQFRNNRWVIFVTTDQHDILDKASEFKEMFLQCSRPEWALDYYREMTKVESPLDYVKNVNDTLTLNQQRVLDALNLKICTE